MDFICEEDRKEIEKLKEFRRQILLQVIEEEGLNYEEKIKRYIKAWKGEED